MGGCTIPGFRAHYFECDVCLQWYWGPAEIEVDEYPLCLIGKKIIVESSNDV